MSVDLDDETAVEPVEYDRDVLLTLWEAHLATAEGPRYSLMFTARDSFLSIVATAFTEDITGEILWCESCYEPGTLDDDYQSVKGGGYACETCIEDSYGWCDYCDEYASEISHPNDGSGVCEWCMDRYYSYCDHCDESYHQDHADDHDHNEDCDCAAPERSLTFTMRNDGEDPLPNDVRTTISLPAGEIDDEGIQAILRLLYREDRYDAAAIVNFGIMGGGIGTKWQTREGNYTKRLSRATYKASGKGLSPEIMSAIGTIARDHSKPVDFQIEVTRDLNQSAADFYHEESCWWSSHSEGRCALKTNGGIGLRTFTGESRYTVSGRAWIMPLKVATKAISWEPAPNKESLTPTSDTMDAAAFVVFNGYGDLSGYTPARILAHMAGMTYRKISFDCEPMYVNSTSGYLVAPEEIATQYTDGSLYLTVDQHGNLYNRENPVEKEGSE